MRGVDIGCLSGNFQRFGGFIQTTTQNSVVVNRGELRGGALKRVLDANRLERRLSLVRAGNNGLNLHQVTTRHVFRRDGELSILSRAQGKLGLRGGERVRQSHGLGGAFASPEQYGVRKRIRGNRPPMLVEDVARAVNRIHWRVGGFQHFIPTEEEVFSGQDGLNLAGRTANAKHVFWNWNDTIRHVHLVDIERGSQCFDVKRGDYLRRCEENGFRIAPRRHPRHSVISRHGAHWRRLKLVRHLLNKAQKALRVRFSRVGLTNVGGMHAVETALARVLRESLRLHQVHVVSIAEDRCIHNLRNIIRHTRLAVERSKQCVFRNGDGIIVVESKGVEHACGWKRVAPVNVVTKVLFVEITSACLDETDCGLFIGAAVALESARRANKLQRVIPVRVLDVKAD